MYKRHCILTFMQGARVLGTPHMRFDSMNGTDAHAITGATSQDRVLNATSTHTRVQPIKRSYSGAATEQQVVRNKQGVERRHDRCGHVGAIRTPAHGPTARTGCASARRGERARSRGIHAHRRRDLRCTAPPRPAAQSRRNGKSGESDLSGAHAVSTRGPCAL